METYRGHIRTQMDAILLFEACRLGYIPRIRRRLSERERLQIGSGCIYVWEEREASMKRWTDGKAWSASRVSGSFLTYREMEGNKRATVASLNESRKRKNSDEHEKRTSPCITTASTASTTSTTTTSTDSDDDLNDAEGCRYKPNGLYKQSFSITTSNDLKLHLIAYHSKADIVSGRLCQPSNDPRLKAIRIPTDLYPDNSPNPASLPNPAVQSPLWTSPPPPLVYSPYPTLPPLPKPVLSSFPPPRSSISSIPPISSLPSPSSSSSSPSQPIQLPPLSSSSKPLLLPPLSQLTASSRLPSRLPSHHPSLASLANTAATQQHQPSSSSSKGLAEDRRALGMLNKVFI